MIQIFTLIAGVVALVMGLNSLFKGEIQLSKTKTISGTSAQIVSGLILIAGFAIIGFALIGLPFVLRQL